MTLTSLLLSGLLLFNYIYCQTYSSLPGDTPSNYFLWYQLPSQVNNDLPVSVINNGASCTIYNDQFYVFGKNYNSWNNSAYSFDFATNKWNLTYFSNSAPSTNGASNTRWFQSPILGANFTQWWMHDGTYLSDYDVIYTSTGYYPIAASNNWFQTFLVYDFATNTLSEPNSNNNPPGRESSPLVYYNESLILFGMCGNVYTSTQDLWYYDIASATWTENNILNSTSKPKGRCGHSFMAIPNTNYGLIFGGHNTNTNGYLNDIWKLDFDLQVFTQIIPNGTAMPSGRAYFVAGYYDGLMLVFSGNGDSFTYYNDFWAYSISQNRWFNLSPLGNLPSTRAQATGIIYNDNFIVYGGRNYAVPEGGTYTISAPLNDFWVFKLGCPNQCSSHGNCSELTCTCDTCHSGQDCSVSICSSYTNNVGVIAGAVSGAVVGLCMTISAGYFIRKKAEKYRKNKMRQKADALIEKNNLNAATNNQ